MFSRQSVFTVLLFSVLFGPFLLFSQSVRINEFLSSNQSTSFDEDGDSSDWLELYNLGAEPVELLGLTLTDDQTQSGKWSIPAQSLQPGAFLLIWASGKDRSGSEFHTNFKLSAAGEFIGLYSQNGVFLDGFNFGLQTPDVSLARIPDGTGDFSETIIPTPGGPNKLEIPGAAAIVFLPESRFYSGVLAVALSSSISGATIRYSTDGSSVTTRSRKYDTPLDLTSTKVIRARAFKGSAAVSEDVSQIYVKDYKGQLPVLSLATDEDNLYGSRGIFDNPKKRGRNWEKTVSVNLLEANGTGFRINAGVRVHGQHSRTYPKKSVRLYFRSDYGDSKLRYPVFAQKKLQEFDRLVVHSGGSFDQYNGSTKWTLLRDPLNHVLMQEMGGNMAAHKPVVLYLNGELWGIYQLRERLNDDYLADNLGIADADLLEWSHNETPKIKSGDLQKWSQLYSFFQTKSMGSQTNYSRAEADIHIDNFIDYQILQIYAGHTDWPHNNNFFFREKVPGTRWQWIIWDSESTFKTSSVKALEWAARDAVRTDISSGDSEGQLFATIFFRKLLENSDFENRFINRFADLLNTTLSRDHVREIFDNLVEEIEPDIEIEADRWDAPVSQWHSGISQVKNYIASRTGKQRTQISDYFGLSGTAELTVKVQPGNGGPIRVNSIIPDGFPWSGRYFTKVPVELEAIPQPAYEFSHWSGASNSLSSTIELNLSSDRTVTAHFVVKQVGAPAIGRFSPLSGEAGTLVNIWGSNLGGTTSVLFNGTVASFSAMADTLVTATVPDSAATGKIKITTNGGTAESQTGFVVIVPTPVPEIFSFTPDSGEIGTEVLIRGHSFFEVNSVFFDSVAAAFSVATDSLLRAIVPDSAHTGKIQIQAAGGTAKSQSDFVIVEPTPAPEIFFFAPDSGEVGTEVLIRGRSFFEVNSVLFDSVDAAFTVEADTVILAVVPDSAVSGKISISAKGGVTVSAEIFTVIDSSVTSVGGGNPGFAVPQSLVLHPAFPNPFNAEVTIAYALPAAAQVKLIVYNMLGQRVRTLVDGHQSAGNKTAHWNGSSASGSEVSSGLYLLVLQADARLLVRKIVLQK